MTNTLASFAHPLVGIAGFLLLAGAALHVTVSPVVQACDQQVCAGTWNVISTSCDDILRCQCGNTYPQNSCYRERGYCVGSQPSDNVIFRKCYLGNCSCSASAAGGGGGGGAGFGGNWCYVDSDCGGSGLCGSGGFCNGSGY